MADTEKREIRDGFRDAVNMTPRELERWLAGDESQSVGDRSGDAESTGHEMGRHLVAILGKKAGDLDDEDLGRMRKATGYVHRHLAQRPSGDVRDTRWRWSLMNWGHDPLK